MFTPTATGMLTPVHSAQGRALELTTTLHVLLGVSWQRRRRKHAHGQEQIRSGSV